MKRLYCRLSRTHSKDSLHELKLALHNLLAYTPPRSVGIKVVTVSPAYRETAEPLMELTHPTLSHHAFTLAP